MGKKTRPFKELREYFDESYNKLYFTADTHFGAERTMILSQRPFNSVEEMDEALIRNWNTTVPKDAIVYHLGDFGNYDRVSELNGEIHLIYGNYERNDLAKFAEQYYKQKDWQGNCTGHINQWSAKQHFNNNLLEKGFKEIIDVDNFYIHTPSPLFPEITYVMMHEPSKAITPLESVNMFNLFGHIHKLQMVKKCGLCVSTDAHNFRPINIKEVEFYLEGILFHYDENVFW